MHESGNADIKKINGRYLCPHKFCSFKSKFKTDIHLHCSIKGIHDFDDNHIKEHKETKKKETIEIEHFSHRIFKMKYFTFDMLKDLNFGIAGYLFKCLQVCESPDAYCYKIKNYENSSGIYINYEAEWIEDHNFDYLIESLRKGVNKILLKIQSDITNDKNNRFLLEGYKEYNNKSKMRILARLEKHKLNLNDDDYINSLIRLFSTKDHINNCSVEDYKIIIKRKNYGNRVGVSVVKPLKDYFSILDCKMINPKTRSYEKIIRYYLNNEKNKNIMDLMLKTREAVVQREMMMWMDKYEFMSDEYLQ